MKQHLFLLLIVAVTTSCNSPSEDESEISDVDTTKVEVVTTWTSGDITLSIKEDSPQFADATLSMNSPTGTVSSGAIAFSYDVTDYDLAAQTDGAGHCANSKDGQHIHLILNNEPYLARYSTEFEEELADGHYVCLSFLSRSYHESIKNGKAFQLSQFVVGDADAEQADLTSAHMFYSRPKGAYVGADAKQVLLDFFLVNCDLSETGYKVKLTVNESAEFTLTRWAPYLIEGLPMGENWLELELIDENGNLVDGPFNSCRRSIMLKEAA